MSDLSLRVPRSARTPVLWVIAVAAAFGLVTTVRDFASAARIFAGPAVLALALMFLTGLVGWWIFTRMRPLLRPPLVWSLAAIGWGMTAATGCAILANSGLGDIWAKGVGVDFASSWGAALTAPINEELLKLAGVALLAIAVPSLVRGPMDGFIIGALTGLGFQIAENWTYALNAIILGGGTDPAGAVTGSFITRVLLSGFGSHWSMTAVAGAGVGYMVVNRLGHGALLVVVALGMHTLFNAPILGTGAGILLKSLINFLIAISLYQTLRRHLYARAQQFLESSDTAPDIDGTALLHRRARRRALASIPAGPDRDQARRRLDGMLVAVADYAYEPEATTIQP